MTWIFERLVEANLLNELKYVSVMNLQFVALDSMLNSLPRNTSSTLFSKNGILQLFFIEFLPVGSLSHDWWCFYQSVLLTFLGGMRNVHLITPARPLDFQLHRNCSNDYPKIFYLIFPYESTLSKEIILLCIISWRGATSERNTRQRCWGRIRNPPSIARNKAWIQRIWIRGWDEGSFETERPEHLEPGR